MRNRKQSYFFFAFAFALAAGGFLASFWPLEVLGMLLAGVAGHPVYAIGLGILLDLAYGAPTGHLHMLLFPMTALAILAVLGRRYGGKYFFDASEQDRL
ncbi:MAG TPA: hypothetical protein VHD55_03355 [Candidatus Paceibacterota bacterium]|nr:hypothetical protein [Candidatus Paceibacterota bacterium]